MGTLFFFLFGAFFTIFFKRVYLDPFSQNDVDAGEQV